MVGKEVLGYHVDEKIGSGGFGTVYKVSKTNAAGTYIRALKHITLPTKKQYASVLNSMGGDYAKADDYFASALKDIVNEIQILSSLSESGVTNIVRYYENDIIETTSPKTYNIYIMMEYLTPFTDYVAARSFTVRDVIALGRDMLEALIACHEKHIIHRDIKDDNIFVSPEGHYKLGDFGVSKALKDKSRAESVKGTPDFIAPEVYRGKEKYDNTVDLYSLGIVLYKLLNKTRGPFLPMFPAPYNTEDEDIAFEARMTGQIPGLPYAGQNDLGKVVLKAIMPRADRYNTAKEFYAALKAVEAAMTDEELNVVVCEPIAQAVAHAHTDIAGGDVTVGAAPVAAGSETVAAFAAPASGSETMAAFAAPASGSETMAAFAAPASGSETMAAFAAPADSNVTMAAEGFGTQPAPIERKEVHNMDRNETMPAEPRVEAPKAEPAKPAAPAAPAPEAAPAPKAEPAPVKPAAPTQPQQPAAPKLHQVKRQGITGKTVALITTGVLLLIYACFHLVLIPIIFGGAVSFADWITGDLDGIVGEVMISTGIVVALVVLHYILLGALIVSVFFAAKALASTKKRETKKVKYTGQNPYLMLSQILQAAKSNKCYEASDSLKTAVDTLKYSKAFGVTKDAGVRDLENEICALIDLLNAEVNDAAAAEKLAKDAAVLKQRVNLRQSMLKK